MKRLAPSLFTNPGLTESVLSTIFNYFNEKVETLPSDRAFYDFVLRDQNGKKIVIEVKEMDVDYKYLYKVKDLLSKSTDISKFILITPSEPQRHELEILDKAMADLSLEINWMSINEFLKLRYNLTVNNIDDLINLQLAAVTSKLDTYNNDYISNDLPRKLKPRSISDSKLLQSNLNKTKLGKNKINSSLFTLRRQFPDSLLAGLNSEKADILKILHIGEKYNDAIIVLSDIKNFSTIVSSADPEDLKEAMSKYYNNARDLVFKYNGILDKFIGDAVLAIFNFPGDEKISFSNSLKFGAELMLLGEAIFDNLLAKMDHTIETGTRIGITYGQLYTLNIGKEQIELTFIGDKINYAARLEKNCFIDGILMSKKFYHKLSEHNSSLIKVLDIKSRSLDTSDTKGQLLPTQAWQITNK